MPIMSERWAGWPMHAEEMRERLGLGRKLPEGSGKWIVQGYWVILLTRAEAQRHAGHAGKPHRIMVECEKCWESGESRLIPFGRLAQHEAAHQRRDAATCRTGGGL